MFEVPWKITGWNLQITHEKNGTWPEPKLHDYVPAVDLQGCRSIFVCWWGGVSSFSQDLLLEVLTLGIAGKKKNGQTCLMITTDRFNPHLSLFIEFPGCFSWRRGEVAMTQRPFIRPHPVEMGYPMHGQLLCSIHFLQFWDSKSWGDIGGSQVQRYWNFKPTWLIELKWKETSFTPCYSHVERKTTVLCDEHPHVSTCVSFLASTTSDVCQTI